MDFNQGLKRFPLRSIESLSTLSTLFLFSIVFLGCIYDWAFSWVISGAAVLSWSLLQGEESGRKILPNIAIWTLLATLNLVYAIAATSWLLYWIFVITCYPSICICWLFQFDRVANLMRKLFRRFLAEIDFIHDKIAFFDIPALEIDTEVDGLMVIRGLTFCLSTLEIVAHGVEVGIKLSDDMELALLADEAKISLFRGIEVGDVFGNLKGGDIEMTFGQLAKRTVDENGEAFMMEDSPLLRRATLTGISNPKPVPKVKMKQHMTDGKSPRTTDVQKGLSSTKQISLSDEEAHAKYQEALAHIEETSLIKQGHSIISQVINSRPTNEKQSQLFDPQNIRDMRAAVCSFLHDRPSIPHPPTRSVRVTSLQTLSPPNVRRFLHRFPMLLRMMLNILAYFHPVKIQSIAVGASGQWITTQLKDMIFQHYGATDSEVKKLENKILTWLTDADFVMELGNFIGISSVPFLLAKNIICGLDVDDVMIYKALPNNIQLKQIVRFSGADATITVPLFLLPHHEHIYPPVPSEKDIKEQEQRVTKSDDKLKVVQAQMDLDNTVKDIANVKISAHAKLPACFDQELLDFVAALVKATKLIEMDKPASPAEEGSPGGIKEFTKNMKTGFKESVKRAAVDAVANDRWIAKMVGKVSKNLETIGGDVGYSGNIPVPMEPYRLIAEDAPKILP
ncbi:MAG: hypothetical protein GOMPHAMPRED_004435 [Gomphillus americanus]|uniref:Uncharacterized protein n=1 Tax=Gomphillus americanus TaxID=1940652 RepID=A0A8H3IUU7_9LECA|nr:MAG: hypothetical protein GOMPHAMPRED_004435 [Gomphillus americanus]